MGRVPPVASFDSTTVAIASAFSVPKLLLRELLLLLLLHAAAVTVSSL